MLLTRETNFWQDVCHVFYRATVILFLITGTGTAQVPNSKSQYRFAQTYLGLQFDWLHQGFATGPALSSPDFGAGRIIIGGRHFWGKADFYISFPVFNKSFSRLNDWIYSENVITGGRIMPIKFGNNIQPFLGIQWVNPGFIYKEGPSRFRNTLGMEAGLLKVFAHSWSIEAGVHYLPGQDYDYYTSRTEIVQTRLPNWGFSLGIKKYFDATSGLASEASRRLVNRTRQTMREKGGLSSFSLAIGPSATLGLVRIPFAENFPWINQKVSTAIHPDIAIGYYFHRPDMALRLSYRPLALNQSGYGLSVLHHQQHLSLEAFKFLFDYNGFVPFAGLAGGITYYHFKTSDRGNAISDQSGQLLSYELVFGWDIRPTDTEWMILRTNLRYLPAPNLKSGGKRITTPQLEINFIQLVIYPERIIRHRQTPKS